jgi:NADPH:quinone reductase-like Zn-dependent oxidoreductase
VLIRVGYSGVYPADSKPRVGGTRAHYPNFDFPFVTGMDAAGVVERTRANVSDFRQGGRVIT